MKWQDKGEKIHLEPSEPFSYKDCLIYLDRSAIECMHKVENEKLYKLIDLAEGLVLVEVQYKESKLVITCLNKTPSALEKEYIAKEIYTLFDLGTNIRPFYEQVKDDLILGELISKYKGLRIIKINGFFEAICWAIIGQQINLTFAYTLKKRFVETYGDALIYNEEPYYIFPKPEAIACLKVEDLRALQFTGRKSEYLIGVAKVFSEFAYIEGLNDLSYEELHGALTQIRGVGPWTADYAILKATSMNQAFPIADVGLHNAIKDVLDMDKKPSQEHIREMAVKWNGWEAYATFYLWRSLYE